MAHSGPGAFLRLKGKNPRRRPCLPREGADNDLYLPATSRRVSVAEWRERSSRQGIWRDSIPGISSRFSREVGLAGRCRREAVVADRKAAQAAVTELSVVEARIRAVSDAASASPEASDWLEGESHCCRGRAEGLWLLGLRADWAGQATAKSNLLGPLTAIDDSLELSIRLKLIFGRRPLGRKHGSLTIW